MTPFEALAFIYICSQADTRTGVWKGSAGALVSELGFQLRTARNLLERMEYGKYIRRLTVPGSHHCYPILVHKFPITQGEHNGQQLNALESKSLVELSYIYSEERVEEHVQEHVEERAPQRRKENREKRIEKKKEASPPAHDARHGPFLEFAKASFENKYQYLPTWDCFGKDGLALAAFLRRAHHVTLEIWQVHIINFFNSSETFTVKQGGSLSYFISHFDAFSSGPLVEKQFREGSDGRSKGKLTGAELARHNAKVCGFAN